MQDDEPAHPSREPRQDRPVSTAPYTPIQPTPPSGVPGLTPTQIRAQLARMGWATALPIVGLDTKHAGAAKAPGIRGWQQRARFEGAETTSADLKAWKRRERQWPGTGIACGNVVAIDADFATDAALAERVIALAFEVFGPTPFLRQGQAPKVAALYRAAEAIPSISLKAADGSGDGLDVLAENRQVVSFGVHRKTLKPYSWIGTESPLTAGPDAAPEITRAQVDTFLAQLRAIVELNSGSGGKSGRGGGLGGGEIVRGSDGRVVDGREYHLTRTVYRVARAMRAEGVELSVAELAARAWGDFAASTALEDGRWSLEAARVKASALLDRVRRGLASLDPQPRVGRETVEPSYPDHTVPVAEAEAAVAGIISDFFERHVPAWQPIMRTWEIAAVAAKDGGQLAPPKPLPTSWAARIETGVGKTAAAIPGAAAAAKAGLSVVYAVPYHHLGTEIAQRFSALGVEALVYRGHTSPDPEAPGSQMCLDQTAMRDARETGMSIGSTVCSQRVDGETVRCPLYDRCGMQRQRRAKPAVWIVPHASLFHQRPGAIPAPDALVIDEGFTMGALPDKPARMSLDAIERAPVQPAYTDSLGTEGANDLDLARAALMRALRDHRDDGPLQDAILRRHGITVSMAGSAVGLEWGRRRDPGIVPAMDPKARKALVLTVGQHNAEVKLLGGIWRELQSFLAMDGDRSGRLSLRYDPETGTRILERRSLDQVRDSWRAPALLLDATLPGPELLEPVMGHHVEIKADIAARWSPHVVVRQIVGAPVSARKLGLLCGQEDAEGRRRVVRDLGRLIGLRAALAWPRVVVVVAPQRLIAKLRDLGLPENVQTGHFGALAGIDRWRDAAGLLCIGQQQPGPLDTEPMAGVVTGREPAVLPPTEKGTVWYPRREGGIRTTGGAGVRVERYHHPDPVVEALRWQVTEASLIQAIGRLRALRRGPDAPAFLDIITDVPLPVTVGAVARWEDARPGAWAEMAGEGVILESAADIEACFPEAAPSRKAARLMAPTSLALTSIRDLTIDVRANGIRVSYKRLGSHAPARAILLPNASADLRRWLGDRLGAIEWIRREARAEPRARPNAQCQRSPASRRWAPTRITTPLPMPSGETIHVGRAILGGDHPPTWRGTRTQPFGAAFKTESSETVRVPASQRSVGNEIWRPQADP